MLSLAQTLHRLAGQRADCNLVIVMRLGESPILAEPGVAVCANCDVDAATATEVAASAIRAKKFFGVRALETIELEGVTMERDEEGQMTCFRREVLDVFVDVGTGVAALFCSHAPVRDRNVPCTDSALAVTYARRATTRVGRLKLAVEAAEKRPTFRVWFEVPPQARANEIARALEVMLPGAA